MCFIITSLQCGDINKEQNTVLIQMEINRHSYTLFFSLCLFILLCLSVSLSLSLFFSLKLMSLRWWCGIIKNRNQCLRLVPTRQYHHDYTSAYSQCDSTPVADYVYQPLLFSARVTVHQWQAACTSPCCSVPV